MNILAYDTEIFVADWIVVFKNLQTAKYTVIHNDPEALKDCIDDDSIYIGFNSKAFDQYIIKAIVCDLTPSEIKKVSDHIVHGGQGWEYSQLKDRFFKFNNVDIMDDMQVGLSLKAIEGHLGMNIKESSVPFDLKRKLTQEELKETVHYCKHDVDATHELIKLRKNYLQTKADIGKLAGLPLEKALSMTNAKLTAALLKAKRQEHDDEREYKYPANLKREYIPQEVFDFFDRLADKSIPDEEVFKSKLNISIGECPVTLGMGGIHGAIPNYIWEEKK